MQRKDSTYKNCFYHNVVYDLFQTKSKERISCGAPDHAEIVTAALLYFAKQKVNIFWENLNKKIFQSDIVVEELIDALNRGVVIEAYVQKDNNDSLFYKIIKDHEDKGSFVKYAPEASKELSQFIIMDGYAVRYIPDKNDCRAIGCAFEPDSCNKLLKSLWTLKFRNK